MLRRHICLRTHIFFSSSNKLYSGSPELFNWTSTFGPPRLPLHCPILVKILLSRFSQNPHLPHLTRFLVLHHPQEISDHPGLSSAEILLGQFSQNHPWCVLSVIFFLGNEGLFLGILNKFFSQFCPCGVISEVWHTSPGRSPWTWGGCVGQSEVAPSQGLMHKVGDGVLMGCTCSQEIHPGSISKSHLLNLHSV